MSASYKRRRSAGLVRNLWVYRKLVMAAILLGLMLWFIVMNGTTVQVWFPFGFGPLTTTSGVAILLGAVAGSVVTALLLTVFLTLRKWNPSSGRIDDADPAAIPEDRPPTDYAAKTPDGFGRSDWSA